VREITEQLIRQGLPLVFVNVLLEQLGLPIPAVPTLIVAGALATEGHLPGWPLLAVALVASLLADTVWFIAGRRYGYRVLKTLCRVSLSPDSCVRQTESLFERQGLVSLLYAKFVPGFSTVAPPLAGLMGSRVSSFLIFDAGGALIWAGSALAVGWAFRSAIERVFQFLEGMGFWALVVLGGALFLFIAFKWWQRQRFYKILRLARITVAELRALMDEGKSPLVMDVRSRGAFNFDPRTIPGAIRLEIEEIDQKVAEIPRNRDIILYCT
jgi:membrane protein DedA with SNARE-associated domain